MIPLSNLSSSTPLLDNIQSRACQSALENVKEGDQNFLEIVVKDKIHRFLLWKEEKYGIVKIKATYEGDFRIVIQKDSKELIEKLIYETPEVIRFQCWDLKGNLLAHVLCWRGFVGLAAKYFTDKANSTIADKTGWSVLHYACYSDNLEIVKSVFANGDKARLSKIIDHQGNHPIDLTDNDIIRQFLTSSILDFQTVFRTSFRISARKS